MSTRRRLRAGVAIALFCIFVVPSLHAKDKVRAWQDGILLDSSTDRGTRVVPTGNGEISARDDVTYYRIDDGKIVYVVARTLRSRRDKALDVTINGCQGRSKTRPVGRSKSRPVASWEVIG